MSDALITLPEELGRLQSYASLMNIVWVQWSGKKKNIRSFTSEQLKNLIVATLDKNWGKRSEVRQVSNIRFKCFKMSHDFIYFRFILNICLPTVY